MSRKGENIYKRKDGRWEARYIKGYDESGRACYGYVYAETYAKAKKMQSIARVSLMYEMPKGALSGAKDGVNRKPARKMLKKAGYSPTEFPYFGFYCNEWLSLNRFRVKESTYIKYAAVIKKHIMPGLGGYTVVTLSSALVGKFGDELLRKGLSPKTVRDTLSLVNSILEYTQTCEPALRPVRIIYPKDERKEMRVLTKDEQERLTSCLLSGMDEYKFGILLSLLTGLRIGEICALRWKDVSVKERTLTVSGTMMRIADPDDNAPRKTRVVITEPKTNTSARTIPLTDYAASLCMEFHSDDPDSFLLTGSAFRYIEPRMLQYRLHKYAKECGIAHLNFHALRHTFATRCVEVGFEIKSLSEILGHTNPSFTLQRYVHSSMELKRSNMDKLAAIWP